MTRRRARTRSTSGEAFTRVDGRISGDLIADLGRASGTIMGLADGVECGVCRVSLAAKMRRLADSLDTLAARVSLVTTPDDVIAQRGEM